MTLLKPCIACGEPTDQTRCPDHRLQEPRTKKERGYGWHWDQLSRRARRLQNFCTDCGTTENLQLDHLPSAWERQAKGLRIRLGIDAEVVCGPCNINRGCARPGSARAQGGHPQPTAPSPDGKAQGAMKRGADALR